MNWTCLVYGAPMLGAMVWWFISAHKWFKGPKVNIDHMMLGRGENVVEGEEAKSTDSGSRKVAEMDGSNKPGELD
jgi:hypothetical protein